MVAIHLVLLEKLKLSVPEGWTFLLLSTNFLLFDSIFELEEMIIVLFF